MKGIIFQLVEDYVTTALGASQWAKVKEQAGVTAPFFVPMNDYPDSDITALVKAASAETGKSTDDIERGLGVFAIPKFAVAYNFYFKPHSCTKDFILKMDDVHQIATQTIAGAAPPRFKYERPSESSLVVIYSSPRKMCSLLKGLIEGSAAHYNERVTITERCCMKKNAARCEIVMEFSK